MIVKTFDNGWGPEYPAKQLEAQLLSHWFEQLESSNIKSVIINSVWYTDDYHRHTVVPYLEQNSVDLIVLVSMLDAAIPQPQWFEKYSKVITIGYYPGANTVDYWALFLDRYFHRPNLISLLRADCMDLAYMCLNRKPHWHRVRLYQQLENLGLLDQGLVSLGGDNSPALRSLESDVEVVNLAPNSGSDQNGIPNDISSLGLIENWQRCFLSVVTETVYGIDQCHFVSEKIYKPILGLRPFLVYDSTGAVEWLLDRGFEPYVRDFSDISDLDLSIAANIPNFLSVLCQQPQNYWQNKFLSLKEKMMYNQNQFYVYVQQQQQKLNSNLNV